MQNLKLLFNKQYYSELSDAVKSLYKTTTKKYVIANYTSLQPTRKALGL